jgi:ribosomal protein L3 glutamine methyltransferase
MLQDLITFRDYWRWAVTEFRRAKLHYGHGTDNASDEALFLLNHIVNLPPEGDQRFLDARLTLEERKTVVSLVQKRVRERVPLPYITGYAWFAGLEFLVDERVLIPRSPIAELIEQGFVHRQRLYRHCLCVCVPRRVGGLKRYF